MSDTQTKPKIAASGKFEPLPPAQDASNRAPAHVLDENRGKGGAYEIRNGQRVLVQRTKAKG